MLRITLVGIDKKLGDWIISHLNLGSLQRFVRVEIVYE